MTFQFLDTNVLLYSISQNPAEAIKRDRAIELLASEGNCLSLQVLQEFYVQATRSPRDDAISHELAAGHPRVVAIPDSAGNDGSVKVGAANPPAKSILVLGLHDCRRRARFDLQPAHDRRPHPRTDHRLTDRDQPFSLNFSRSTSNAGAPPALGQCRCCGPIS